MVTRLASSGLGGTTKVDAARDLIRLRAARTRNHFQTELPRHECVI